MSLQTYDEFKDMIRKIVLNIFVRINKLEKISKTNKNNINLIFKLNQIKHKMNKYTMQFKFLGKIDKSELSEEKILLVYHTYTEEILQIKENVCSLCEEYDI